MYISYGVFQYMLQGPAAVPSLALYSSQTILGAVIKYLILGSLL